MAAKKAKAKLKIDTSVKLTIPALYVWGDSIGDIANYTKANFDASASACTLNGTVSNGHLVVQNEGCDESFIFDKDTLTALLKVIG